MPKRLVIAGGVLAALAVLGGAAAYAYYFSSLRGAPASLALSSPSPTASAPAGSSPAASTGASAGTWQVATGSIAGYRVKEQFAGQTSSHEAVARTSSVAGQVTITQSGGADQLASAMVTVQLSGLASVDQVAGYNVTNRDRIVSQTLNVSQYPTAVFVAQPLALPAGIDSGQAVAVTVPGTLTVHGVTRNVTATVQVRVTGSTVQVAGSISANMTDFGVNPPTVPFTTVQPAITLEFQLNLSKTG